VKGRRLVITVDGPAGAGKSTVSRALAERLGYVYVDTGAMYRAVAVLVQRAGKSDDFDEEMLEQICRRLELHLSSENGQVRVIANGEDLTEEIREPHISELASAVSRKAVVRKRLSEIQRTLGQHGGVVLEGRDMGTVVFPDADIKFFLDASSDVRALRRYLELTRKGKKVSRQQVYDQLVERDRNDIARELAPLKPAADAILVDSTNLQVDEVVDFMLDRIRTLSHHHD